MGESMGRFACIWVLWGAIPLAAACAADRVETLDLRAVEGNVVALSAQKVEIDAAAGRKSLDLADVEGIYLRDPEDLRARAAQAIVQTTAGDFLAAEKIAASDGKLRFTSPAVGAVTVPFSAVACIYMPAMGQTAGTVLKRASEVKDPEKPSDMVIVDQGKEWAGVDGVLMAMGDQKVTFRLGDQDKQIETRLVKAIRLAAPPATAAAAGRILFTDGSELLFSSAKLEGDRFSFFTAAAGEVSVPRKSVAGIRFRSGRMTPLAAITPAEVQEYGLFDSNFPHRLDRSVGGGPLRLGGRTYASGIGLHSFAQLAYKIDGQYKLFAAMVGIDDAVRPAGNATLVFLGDGKELAKPQVLTGKDAPREVRLDVTGVKSFVVRVEFGPDNLPVGDHVDLGAARLIK
jgi:hypothetical protein